MKPAFLIIDTQKEHLDGKTLYPSAQTTAEYINYIADHFRKKSYPVIAIYDEQDVKKGDPKFEFIDDIKLQPTDERIHKMHGNSFKETNLQARLKELGVDFVLISGFRAENCVLATISGAKDLGIPHAVLKGGILSTSLEGASSVEKISAIASYGVVTKFF